ncbi:hypothetical protein GEMRC1_008175 [Eukaryota sp. GEM-RC1]
MDSSPPLESTIAEEYKIWKKNTPYLYDFVLTHALVWPSFTVEWLPECIPESDGNYDVRQLILGTHTSREEQDYLMLAEVHTPSRKKELDIEECITGPGDVGGYGVAQSKVQIKQRIPHDGEVNRARICPHQSSLIATKDPFGKVHLFDYTSYKSSPLPDEKPSPMKTLHGHTQEGYGLDWSKTRKGYLTSGAYDQTVCLWDVETGDRDVDTLWKCSAHEDKIEDVAFHPKTSDIIGSVGDDGKLVLYDLRTKAVANSTVAHQGHPCNALSWSLHRDTLLLTAGGDGDVKLFDTRALSQSLYTFSGHSEEVFGVSFSLHSESIFASSGADRRIAMWDMEKIGASQTSEEAEDGPPELLFLHGGHTNRVSDFSWCPTEDWMIASVDDDNVLQVWEMAHSIHNSINPEDVTDQMVE